MRIERALWQAFLMLGAVLTMSLYEAWDYWKSNLREAEPIIASMHSPPPMPSEKSLPPFYVGRFTAYTSRSRETDDTPYITADGTDLRSVSRCVAANNDLPFGTLLFVEGIGECEIRDRMNDRHGPHRFDLYFGENVDKALRFGERKLRYFFL